VSVYIFTGPTLAPEEAREILDAAYLPPVAQGDVYRVALKQPRAIGIVDGYFERVPAVWHKEILWAMARGIHVFGSASMGALRAAELHVFGMEGVGAVYEAFRDGRIEDDDEVAVAHGPASVAYRGGSEAMVNIRFTLERAERESLISQQTGSTLLRLAKDLFYPDRSYARVLELAKDTDAPHAELRALQAWLPTGRVNQKRDDALAMLRVMRDRLRGELPPKQVSYVMENTRIWNQATSIAGALPADADNMDAVLPTALVEELRLDGSYARALQGARVRVLSTQAAAQRKVVVTGEMMQETGDRWRDQRGLADLDAFHQWLQERDLGEDAFSRMIRDEALRQLMEHSLILETRQRLVDELHMSGEYDRLAARARDKQRILEEHSLLNPGLTDVEKTWDDVLCWYFVERLGSVVPANLTEYAHESGFERELDLRRAILREYCYAEWSHVTP
jgi:hypothetical protein